MTTTTRLEMVLKGIAHELQQMTVDVGIWEDTYPDKTATAQALRIVNGTFRRALEQLKSAQIIANNERSNT